jgi:hypothetical protein
MIEAFVWGGTQITWVRVVLTVVVEGVLGAYVFWATRFFGR